jgi:hypothetical protein
VGYHLSDLHLCGDLIEQLRQEADRLAVDRASGRMAPVDLAGKDACGLLTAVPGLDRKSLIAFDAARSSELADLVTTLIGEGWVPFRSQVVLPSDTASLGQWHQDQTVYDEHLNHEIAVTIAIPLDSGPPPLHFAPTSPEIGRLITHSQRHEADLAFQTCGFYCDDEVTPVWETGRPLAFHAFAMHKWRYEINSRVCLFSYRTSQFRRRR